ncbi:MAG: hypothetical protein ACJ79D_22010, partial [Myxococcales bacterium]
LRSAAYFDFTAAAALQIALHGFVGLSYLAAGAISVLLLAATLAFRIVRSRNAVAVGSQP